MFRPASDPIKMRLPAHFLFLHIQKHTQDFLLLIAIGPRTWSLSFGPRCDLFLIPISDVGLRRPQRTPSHVSDALGLGAKAVQQFRTLLASGQLDQLPGAVNKIP
jgi:hypothetical protein